MALTAMAVYAAVLVGIFIGAVITTLIFSVKKR
jgi:hypothetical protein